MRYVKADNVLPEEIIKLIQNYIDGEYLYIPRKCENQKSWGEKNGTRKALRERNNQIFMKYMNGAKALDLANEYFLSEPSIRRIISREKKFVQTK
ncbi:Mor transcription activator family protein [Clostridium oryzae]|uniref:Mor transcription activator family protein n=2 Tax=Clostridium oryzae TaxID=1450648 RepID=A0A1V4IL51_9CLOT|nr:Mor transcription activator family protein [Clostridium oryzae]